MKKNSQVSPAKESPKKFAGLKQISGVQYGRTLFSITAKSFFLMFFTAIAMLILLNAGKLIWSMYTATQVGQKFSELYPQTAMVIVDIVSEDLFLLAGKLAISAVMTCLIIGVILQFTGLHRILYLSRGRLGRIIFIVAPLWAAIAWQLQNAYGYEDPKTAFLLCVIPTLCVYARCLNYAAELVPEITDIFIDAKNNSLNFSGKAIGFFSFLKKKQSSPPKNKN